MRSTFPLHATESKTPTAGDVLAEEGVSRREWSVVLLLVISAVINYVDRSNLSIAAPEIQRHFALSPIQIGTLLSAFFWTYALIQITGIAGWFSDRFPVGWVMLGGYVLWSGATMVTGLATSFAGLFLALLLLGVGESVAYPCYSRVFAELPQQQRGRANAFIDAGTKTGPAVGAFLGGLLLVHIGWRMLFIALGAGGLLWVLPWLRVMPRFGRRVGGRDSPPLSSIARLLRVKCAWGTFLGHFCGNYFLYFLLAWLPIYLVREEKMPVGPMSRLASAVFLLIASSTLVTGWISDRLITAGGSPTRVRKCVVVGGLAVASTLMMLAFVHGNLPVSIGIMTVACIGYGAFASNHWAISQTLAGPAMAGRWTSMQNGVANLAGIVAPWMAGVIVQINGSSRMAFLITGLVTTAGAFAWALLVRHVEPVQWDAPVCASGT
ncbi:MAG TPA: MFS transporter [Terracidiphilus sp.]|nr:MFS transporter [Terracidiphilus sp.]